MIALAIESGMTRLEGLTVLSAGALLVPDAARTVNRGENGTADRMVGAAAAEAV